MKCFFIIVKNDDGMYFVIVLRIEKSFKKYIFFLKMIFNFFI